MNVSNSFIDEYIQKAPPVYSLLYLYGLRHSENNLFSFQNGILAKNFNVLEVDVSNCWKFWENSGLVSIIHDNCIKFIELPKENIKIDTVDTNIPEMRSLLLRLEKEYKKILSVSDCKTIYYIYEKLRVPIEVIHLLITFCVRVLKSTSIKRLENMAVTWAENKILSVDRAEEYIKEYEFKSGIKYSILKMLGIERTLTKREESFLEDWVLNFNFDMSVYNLAFEIMINSINKVSLPYMNKLLTNWNDAGLRDCTKIEEFNEKTKPKRYVKSSKPKRESRFTEEEFEEIEALVLKPDI